MRLSGLDDELKATRPLLQYALIEVKSHNEKIAEKIYLELLRKLRR